MIKKIKRLEINWSYRPQLFKIGKEKFKQIQNGERGTDGGTEGGRLKEEAGKKFRMCPEIEYCTLF